MGDFFKYQCDIAQIINLYLKTNDSSILKNLSRDVLEDIIIILIRYYPNKDK